MANADRYAPVSWGLVPLLPLVLALGFGVVVADWLGYAAPGVWLVVTLVLSLLLLLNVIFPRPQRWVGLVASGWLLLAVFAFGGWRASTTYLPGRADFFVHHQTPDDLLAGTVLSVKPARKTMRVVVALAALVPDSLAQRRVSGRVLLYLTPDERTASLRAGDQLVFSGQPRVLQPPLNPGVFDLSSYWRRQHVYHQLYLGDPNEWRRVATTGGGLGATAATWRAAWFRTFQDHLTGDQLAVAAALVLGQRDLISAEVKSAYTETGAVHVLAVSGLHVGIIFLILRFLLVRVLRLDRLKHGEAAVALLSIVCVWAFAFVSGLSASVQRAAIMFTILALGGIGRYRSHVFNTLSFAALGMLIIDPAQLFRVGFQLSFTAIIGIVAFATPLSRLLYLPHRWLRSAWSALAASTGAQLGTLPLSLLYFKQFPLYFLLSGTVVVLFAFATMFAGLLHGLVAGLLGSSGGGRFTGGLLSFIVEWQNALIFFFQQLPGALLKIPYFDAFGAILLASGIALLAVYIRWRRRPVLWVGLLLVLAAFFWARSQVQTKLEGGGVVVFHLSRSTLVDLVSPTAMAWSVGQQPGAADLNWSAGPYRASRAYQPLQTFPLPLAADTTLATGVDLVAAGFRAAGTHWRVLDGNAPSSLPAINEGITHLLVVNGYDPKKLPALPAGLRPTIVVDGSNPRYLNEAWRTVASTAQVTLHLTAEDGAYVWPLPKASF